MLHAICDGMATSQFSVNRIYILYSTVIYVLNSLFSEEGKWYLLSNMNIGFESYFYSNVLRLVTTGLLMDCSQKAIYNKNVGSHAQYIHDIVGAEWIVNVTR